MVCSGVEVAVGAQSGCIQVLPSPGPFSHHHDHHHHGESRRMRMREGKHAPRLLRSARVFHARAHHAVYSIGKIVCRGWNPSAYNSARLGPGRQPAGNYDIAPHHFAKHKRFRKIHSNTQFLVCFSGSVLEIRALALSSRSASGGPGWRRHTGPVHLR
jgi:hypothetical protein